MVVLSLVSRFPQCQRRPSRASRTRRFEMTRTTHSDRGANTTPWLGMGVCTARAGPQLQGRCVGVVVATECPGKCKAPNLLKNSQNSLILGSEPFKVHINLLNRCGDVQHDSQLRPDIQFHARRGVDAFHHQDSKTLLFT